ncbi:uncharacterized protein LOC122650696 [Telopea speciosissima]|uniref:uncharacterized protein LOC122650696 n=1 Tax=Telopea speciosissima TaxID=54955 RepID=UPI001CC5755D|nr:uncharacterized protein LOC122650696 [Telopea speciosissima]
MKVPGEEPLEDEGQMRIQQGEEHGVEHGDEVHVEEVQEMEQGYIQGNTQGIHVEEQGIGSGDFEGFDTQFTNLPAYETTGKLRSQWDGPFVVVSVAPHGAIEIRNPQNGKTFKINGQRLKPYVDGLVDGQLIESLDLVDVDYDHASDGLP